MKSAPRTTTPQENAPKCSNCDQPATRTITVEYEGEPADHIPYCNECGL